MDVETFRDSVKRRAMPNGLSEPLQALWKEKQGQWDAAHQIVQECQGRTAAWVHAYLHRKEGDADNAAYWYRRAERPVSTVALDQEWEEIVRSLLQESDARD